MDNRPLTSARPSPPHKFDVGRPATPIPPRSCDCHTHVFGPNDRYPFAAARNFTPEAAHISHLDWVARRLGFDRVVLVQPSVYGTDNRLLLDSLSSTSLDARGVAVVAPDISHGALESMHAVGVRGIRLNAPTLSARDFADLLNSFGRIFAPLQELGWHLNIFGNPAHYPVLIAALETLPIPVVIDHLGGPPNGTETLAGRIDALRGLIESGKCWIKISAPYRIGSFGTDGAILRLISSLFRARRDRLLWGSDWPHTPKHNNAPVTDDRPTAFRQIDPARLLDRLDACFNDEDARTGVLRDNPNILLRWD